MFQQTELNIMLWVQIQNLPVFYSIYHMFAAWNQNTP